GKTKIVSIICDRNHTNIYLLSWRQILFCLKYPNSHGLSDYHGMRIYSERPQYTDSNRSPVAAHADDFFAVPLMAKPAEARLIPREEAPARPDLGRSTIIS